MKAIKWCENMLQEKEAQKLLEEKVTLLMDMFFPGKSDYAKEKFIKSFGEGIIYLENNLLYSRGLHPSQLQKNMVELSANPAETIRKMEEVKNSLLTEINRQHRHATIFLAEFK